MDYKISKTETQMLGIVDKKGNERYVITRKDTIPNTFFIYSIENGVATKLGKGNSPLELEKKYKVWQTINKKGK